MKEKMKLDESLEKTFGAFKEDLKIISKDPHEKGKTFVERLNNDHATKSNTTFMKL